MPFQFYGLPFVCFAARMKGRLIDSLKILTYI